MTREYHLPSGEVIPPDLLERIASDVTAFNAAQTPEARSASALRKIGNELPRLRTALDGGMDEHSMIGRIAVALEIETLISLGYPPDDIRAGRRGNALAARYGLTTLEP
jgi:hypothetical protein